MVIPEPSLSEAWAGIPGYSLGMAHSRVSNGSHIGYDAITIMEPKHAFDQIMQLNNWPCSYVQQKLQSIIRRYKNS